MKHLSIYHIGIFCFALLIPLAAFAKAEAFSGKYQIRPNRPKQVIWGLSVEIRSNIGDFSAFDPAESSEHYVVEVHGGELKTGISDPFLIRPNIWQEQY